MLKPTIFSIFYNVNTKKYIFFFAISQTCHPSLSKHLELGKYQSPRQTLFPPDRKSPSPPVWYRCKHTRRTSPDYDAQSCPPSGTGTRTQTRWTHSWCHTWASQFRREIPNRRQSTSCWCRNSGRFCPGRTLRLRNPRPASSACTCGWPRWTRCWVDSRTRLRGHRQLHSSGRTGMPWDLGKWLIRGIWINSESCSKYLGRIRFRCILKDPEYTRTPSW